MTNVQERELRAAARYAGWVCAYLWVAVIAANLPARLALGEHHAQFGHEPIGFTLTGLAVDSVDCILIFLAINLAIAGIGKGLWQRRFRQFGEVLDCTLVPTTALLFALVMLGTIWASEHRIERGLYPTMYELSSSVDKEFALAATKVFALERFRYTPWISVLILALTSIAMRRRVRLGVAKTSAFVAMSTIACGAIFGLCFAWHGLAPFVIPSITGWQTVWSPGRVFVSYGLKRHDVRHGSISLFHRLRLPNEMLAAGAQNLGIDSANVQQLPREGRGKHDGCLPHPLAQAFPSSPPRTEGNAAYDPVLASHIDHLSQRLFRDRLQPIRVWLVMLEGFRGDDVHALHDKAPRDVTPFMNHLYEEAQRPEPSVAVAKYAMQAGNRTSHALSALVCGLGTMPFGLSASRDLGLLPFRCLPDILKDAGFRLAYYYGSNPSYDNMLAFLNYHGFYHMKTGKQFVETSSFDGWGVLDHAVYMQSVEDSKTGDTAQSQFNLVMSLTNHFPFQRPTDIPKEVEARLHSAIDAKKMRKDDVARLTTFAYADWAFEQFVLSVQDSEEAPRTMVLAVADHTTVDRFLWRDKPLSRESILPFTRVPFALILPDALIDSSSDPAGVRRALADITAHLASTPLSQNDIPLFILHMLFHSREVAGIAPEHRWHTLGGQRLSPTFRVNGHNDAVILGVDGFSKVFLVDKDGTGRQLTYDAVPTLDVDKAMEQDPTLLPTAALFSAMMQGYARTCWESRVIRNNL